MSRETDLIQFLATAREEYHHEGDVHADVIAAEVRTARWIARMLDGDPAEAFGWLPSWRWDTWREMTQAETQPPEAGNA